MTNDEIRALLEKLKDHHHALLTLGNFSGRALALDKVIEAIETLLAREAEVLKALQPGPRPPLGFPGEGIPRIKWRHQRVLYRRAAAILYPPLAEEKTNG